MSFDYFGVGFSFIRLLRIYDIYITDFFFLLLYNDIVTLLFEKGSCQGLLKKGREEEEETLKAKKKDSLGMAHGECVLCEWRILRMVP